jgi:hypothetical protein
MRIKKTTDELLSERDAVAHLLKWTWQTKSI